MISETHLLFAFDDGGGGWSAGAVIVARGTPGGGSVCRRCGLGAGVRVLTVAALQHADQPAAAADVCDLHDLGGGPGEVLRLQVDAHARRRLTGELAAVAHVSRGGVEADRQKNQRGVEGAKRRDQPQLNGLAVAFSA